MSVDHMPQYILKKVANLLISKLSFLAPWKKIMYKLRSEAIVICKARISSYYEFISLFFKSKQLIQTAQYDIYKKI